MAYEATGKLIKKYEIESKSATFQTREFVIEMPGNYPEFVKFQLTQERCSLVDPYNEGEEIKVTFDLRGREWQGKYFTNLNAWKVSGETGSTQTPSNSVPMQQVNNQMQETESAAPVEEPVFDKAAMDDLPF
jgi:single-strand DNA-binding protein